MPIGRNLCELKPPNTVSDIINDDLSNIKLPAQDEKFQYNKPVLAGIDIPSLYCYLLVYEEHRDFETWGTHLLDLKAVTISPSTLTKIQSLLKL